MGNICPPNKNSAHTNGGRSTGYISGDQGRGIRVGGNGVNNAIDNSYPIVNVGNGTVGYQNHHQPEIMGKLFQTFCLINVILFLFSNLSFNSEVYPNQHQHFQVRNGFNNHFDHNPGLLPASPSSIALIGRNNSNDSGEKPNFIALFDYEQVIFKCI